MNETLTNWQLAFILFGAILGQGFITFPKILAESAGTGGWITVLISTAIVVIITYIFTYLGYVHKNKTLYEYSQLLTGKYITYIFMTIFILYFFLFFTMNARLFCEDLKIFIMPRTPINAIYILLLFVIYLILSKGLRLIARICEFYGIIVLIGLAIIFTIISTQGKLINIRPILGSADMLTYFKAIPVMIVPFLGFEILGCIGIDRKNTKKVFKYTTLMIVVIGILFIYASESCLSVIGVDSIIYYKLILFNVLRSLDIPFLDFLKRLDGTVLFLWFMSIVTHLSVFAYGAIIFIHKCFKKISYQLLIPIILILALFISQIPKTYEEVENALISIGYLTIFTALLIPVILLIITKVKKYDKNI